MAKIAYVGLPAHGHTNPTLPVMKALVEGGHEVLYYNGESFREKVAPTGVTYRALPEPLPTEREISEALYEMVNAAKFISRIAPHLTRFLIAEFERERPDAVIYDSAAMWGYIAARTNNIPQICFITTFVLDGSMGEMGFVNALRFMGSVMADAPKLLRWRQEMAREFGKENSGGITEYADLNIVFTSKAFHPKNGFVDERFKFVGPSLNSATRDGEFPFELLKDGRKVYISLGTINHLDLDFYRAVFKAFAAYPAQFILSVGKLTEISQLGQIPDNFLVYNYVPQLEILKRVDAFITHGGMNSVHEGLYYGVPEITVPHQFEQFLNSKRVAGSGAGIMLGDKRPYGRVTAEALQGALDELLNNPTYRQQAEHYGRTLQEAGGYQRAVEEIESFLADKI